MFRVLNGAVGVAASVLFAASNLEPSVPMTASQLSMITGGAICYRSNPIDTDACHTCYDNVVTNTSHRCDSDPAETECVRYVFNGLHSIQQCTDHVGACPGEYFQYQGQGCDFNAQILDHHACDLGYQYAAAGYAGISGSCPPP